MKVKVIGNTLSNLGLARLATRLLRGFRYRYIYPQWGRLIFKPPPTLHNIAPATWNFTSPLSSLTPNDGLMREAEALRRRTFVFLNLPAVTFAPQADWQLAPNQDPLWRYYLHYGEWALTLAQALHLTGDADYRQSLLSLLADWLEHNPPGSTPGWEPYPLSRRLVAWSKVALILREDKEWQSFWQSSLAPSLHQQTRLLAANLEQDLANNHLLANFRALAWMGLLFPHWPGASTWRNSGLAGLWGEMDRQVLPDGVHDERSLSYQAIVLEDLLETWDLCQRKGVPTPPNLEEKFPRMIRFLEDMQAPDASFPMLNDTVPGYPAEFQAVAAQAKARLTYWTQCPEGDAGGDPGPPAPRLGPPPHPGKAQLPTRRGDTWCSGANPGNFCALTPAPWGRTTWPDTDTRMPSALCYTATTGPWLWIPGFTVIMSSIGGIISAAPGRIIPCASMVRTNASSGEHSAWLTRPKCACSAGRMNTWKESTKATSG